MDMMIFYIVSMILNKPVKKLRLFGASAIAAAIYCIILYLPHLQNIPYLIFALIVPVLPILYLYKPLSLKAFLKLYILCMGTACLIGGTTFSLWFICGYQAQVNEISMIWLVMIAFVVTAAFYMAFNQIRRRLIFPAFEYDITIKHTNKVILVKSILDTGNCLYTSIEHKPVIVVTYDALKDLFTPKQAELINKYKNDILELVCHGEFIPSYIIPFNSVGCSLGMLLGVEVDEVAIHRSHFKKSVDRCIIGISFNNIFHDKSYHALLHPEFILN